MTFHLVENNDHRPSIAAVDDDGGRISAGAFLDRGMWRIYVAGPVIPPDLPVTYRHAMALTKDEAAWFVQIIAHWYSERRTA